MPPTFPHFAPRVVGGEEAPVGGYPFIVSLQFYSEHFCAGSIVNENWIITAGHCIKAIPHLFIRHIKIKAGKHNIRIAEDYEQTAYVDKAVIHDRYEGLVEC